MSDPVSAPVSAPLREIAGVFLRLGFTAFGGPAAHIALMKEEFVVRRKWLTEAEFLDLLGATNLIPGPNSTEMAIHLGYRRGGWIGLIVAGLCFLLPAALIVSGFAWAYVRFGALPTVAGLLQAVKPVVVAVVLQAMAGLVRPALKNVPLTVLGIAVLGAALFGLAPPYLLFGAGFLTGLARWWQGESSPVRRSPGSLLALLAGVAGMIGLPVLLTFVSFSSRGAVPLSSGALFAFFLKVGATLYGSGYVLLSFLREEPVLRWRWLTEGQLLDAVAVGQVTPGPVFTTATFIGYVLSGPFGAFLATLGIFLPSFVFVALSGPLIPRLRQSPVMAAFLDGVNVAALALLATVVWETARTAFTGPFTVSLAILSAVLLIRYRVNSAWLLLAAAGFGAVCGWLGLRVS
ncbi:MAG: chromate efflux transporter [Capsulimonadales bacterium]|nr:chromate efflux transporter [Capsulimonadales bacterium]